MHLSLFSVEERAMHVATLVDLQFTTKVICLKVGPFSKGCMLCKALAYIRTTFIHLNQLVRADLVSLQVRG